MRRAILSSAAILGLAAGCALVATSAMARTETGAAVRTAAAAGKDALASRWGNQVDGRWYAGAQAPGGWAAYHRPAYGFALPTYWMQPTFYIADFDGYGLPMPQSGYGWSRYYDDAVLTDGYGRVYAVRTGLAWDGLSRSHDLAPAARHSAPERGAPPPPAGMGPDDGYQGRWVGTWYGDDGRVYNGEYEGSYEGVVRGADAGPPPPHGRPHWGPPPPPQGPYGYGPGRYGAAPGGQVYYAGPGVTTIVIQPGTTTTRYVEEEVVTTPRRWKPRRKAHCGC